MKRFGFPIAGLCIAFCLADSCLQAQPANRGGQGQQGRGQRGGGRAQGGQGIGGPKGAGRNEQQTPPLLRVFDTNGDGELTENEIENAASALKKLDTDRNGRLSAEELQPTGSNGQSGSGGQRGAAGRGGQQPQGRGEAKGGPGARSGSPLDAAVNSAAEVVAAVIRPEATQLLRLSWLNWTATTTET